MIYALTLGAALGLPEEGLASLGIVRAAARHRQGRVRRDDPTQAEHGAACCTRRSGAEILVAPAGRRPRADARRVRAPHGHRRLRLARARGRLLRPPVQPHGRDRGPVREPHEARRARRRRSRPTAPSCSCSARPARRSTRCSPGCSCRRSASSPSAARAALGPCRSASCATQGDDPLQPRCAFVYDERGIELEEPRRARPRQDERDIVEVVDRGTQLAVRDLCRAGL